MKFLNDPTPDVIRVPLKLNMMVGRGKPEMTQRTDTFVPSFRQGLDNIRSVMVTGARWQCMGNVCSGQSSSYVIAIWPMSKHNIGGCIQKVKMDGIEM